MQNEGAILTGVHGFREVNNRPGPLAWRWVRAERVEVELVKQCRLVPAERQMRAERIINEVPEQNGLLLALPCAVLPPTASGRGTTGCRGSVFSNAFSRVKKNRSCASAVSAAATGACSVEPGTSQAAVQASDNFSALVNPSAYCSAVSTARRLRASVSKCQMRVGSSCRRTTVACVRWPCRQELQHRGGDSQVSSGLLGHGEEVFSSVRDSLSVMERHSSAQEGVHDEASSNMDARSGADGRERPPRCSQHPQGHRPAPRAAQGRVPRSAACVLHGWPEQAPSRLESARRIRESPAGTGCRRCHARTNKFRFSGSSPKSLPGSKEKK